MKWLPLKMNFLPLIFQEINCVTEEYISLLSKLRQLEQEKTSEEKIYKNNDEFPLNKSNQNQEESESVDENNKKENEIIEENELFQLTIKKFNGLRESIGKRINELETFYEDNIEDVRISNFEKARLRLKKLLMYNYENINKIENSSQQHNIFIKDEGNYYNKKISEDKKKQILENNKSIEKQLAKEKNKEIEKAKIKLLGSDERAIKNKKDEINKKKVIKLRGDEGFLKPIDRNRRDGGKKERENFDKMNMDDYSKFKEIVFKIKLSQDEFKLLMKEKKNKGNISPYLFK